MIEPRVLGLCVPLIEEFERGPSGTFAATAYIDPTGNYTIGWGHKLRVNDPLMHTAIDAGQAEELRTADLDLQNAYIAACLGPAWSGLKNGQKAGLICFVYNLGIGRFEKSSMHGYIVDGRMDLVPAEFDRWVKGGSPPKTLPGLVRRRAAERALWEQP